MFIKKFPVTTSKMKEFIGIFMPPRVDQHVRRHYRSGEEGKGIKGDGDQKEMTHHYHFGEGVAFVSRCRSWETSMRKGKRVATSKSSTNLPPTLYAI
jgi:hypothetical protein